MEGYKCYLTEEKKKRKEAEKEKNSLPRIDEESDGESFTFIIDTTGDPNLQQDFLPFVEEGRSKYGYDEFDKDNMYEFESNDRK